MNSSIKVDKNSKLYQKFLQAKGKRQEEQMNQSNPQKKTSRVASRIEQNHGDKDDNLKKEEHTQSSSKQMYDENSDYFNRSSFDSDRKNVRIINKEIFKSKAQIRVNEYQEESSKKDQDQIIQPIVKQFMLKMKQNHSDQHKNELEIQNQSLKRKVNQLMNKCDMLTSQLQETKQALIYRQQQALKWREQYESLNDDISVAMRESIKVSKQSSTIRQHKENQNNLIDELKNQKQRLERQNQMAKEYIYKITLKLYYSQQEKQKLKEQFGLIENKNQNDKLSVWRQAQIKAQNLQSKPLLRKQRIQTKQRITNRRQSAQQQANIKNKSSIQSTLTRVQYINIQLNEISTSSIQNGRQRRRKIQLQRELQQLNNYIKHTLQ